MHLIPDVDIVETGKSFPLAATLEYQPQREIWSAVSEQRSSKELQKYKMYLEAILTEMLEDETTRGMNMEEMKRNY